MAYSSIDFSKVTYNRKEKPVHIKLAEQSMPEPNTGCHLWTGLIGHKGYGRVSFKGSLLAAHRVAYQIKHGPIPDGLVLDHLCRIPSCVNPDHLEPVTHRVNINRGLRGKLRTHCKYGHAYDGNVLLSSKGYRSCETCVDNLYEKFGSSALARDRGRNERRGKRFKQTAAAITSR